jgi:electron transfer flavoprotein alpha subunit
MQTILFLAHVEADGALAQPAFEALGAAKTLVAALPDTALAVGLIGANPSAAADLLAACGATRFWGVAGAEFSQARYATDVAAAEAIGRAAQPDLILIAGTSRWLRVAAGLAHRFNGRADTHVTGISVVQGAPAITRWYYRQRMEAVQQRTQRPWIIALDPGCHAPWSGASGKTTLELVPVTLTDNAQRTVFQGIQSPPADAQTIRPDARLLLVAGAGWTKKQADGKVHAEEAQRLILNFLQLGKASLGGTKSLVDLSGEGQAVLPFMTHLNQVGQTGSTPRHPKGLATCCHGEEPHVVGWRFINERRAVNLDPNCGWARGKADVLYVADAFAVLEKVNARLAAP